MFSVKSYLSLMKSNQTVRVEKGDFALSKLVYFKTAFRTGLVYHGGADSLILGF